eukprot:TRINITY_DN32486_c0_g1_i1.p1 TRINITY_DN32486_c0_g1~~TRINITY_DN32486_c0_g1_i1.p1  ORF type:complete len:690 (+),score=197.09 TRINITY_DN32486_c0_g1_i1:43-2112(+)
MMASLVLLAQVAAVAAVPATPNFLFVLADDMGWGDVGFNKEYHQPGAGGVNWTVNAPHTPNLDAAVAKPGTIMMSRMYAGSAVCSPTRSSVLSGRSPRRECIDGAEGCGQDPAWSCYDKMPFPSDTFTAAEAAKENGYATFFAGKWHLGDFWIKGEDPTYAMKKWPSSNPGHHGFDEWHATEASAESSTPNCGCNPDWKNQGQGCITGTGEWERDALDCTNYWRWNETHADTCLQPALTDRTCVANLTEKIEGDDSVYIMGLFEDFLTQKKQDQPFLAMLFLHTNHKPHYALPEYYHAYNDTFGEWAGNYLGTITQMDSQIGVLMEMLEKHNIDDNTLLWFTVDNGAHPGERNGGQLAASNGLRQCKASLFEGGIREPGFIRWPAVVGNSAKTSTHTTCTVDFLPTVLDILQVPHPKPSWAMDGESILPLLTGDMPLDGAPRSTPLGFAQSGQWALINDTGSAVWKIVRGGAQGQCDVMSPPYTSGEGTYLFRLDQDPTESNDLCDQEPAMCLAMNNALDAFELSVNNSRLNESGCQDPNETWSMGRVEDHMVPANTTHGFQLRTDNGVCLGVTAVGAHMVLELSSCNRPAVMWEEDANGHLRNVHFPTKCVGTEVASHKADNVLMLDDCTAAAGLQFTHTGLLKSATYPDQCVSATESSRVAAVITTSAALSYCNTHGSRFERVNDRV